ncbi:MAG: hypothetical protein A2176_15830 [Spirochaetes bacterium RBG_13_51_14]|nr:MAG: hypothetical protein A2176_15830 [Spirochaetes bacterium RBG_13_51_14]
MSNCWYCKIQKGKRYCSPLDNILCPICCAKNRIKNINCAKDCRYLEGVAIQAARDEDKRFTNLIRDVPHGQYSDIFKDEDVAIVAFEIESFIRGYYMSGKYKITDKMVYDCYKNIYKIKIENNKIDKDEMTDLIDKVLLYYDNNSKKWLSILDKDRIGQIFLRLMHSVRQMSGGEMGEFGYLNFLKNNLSNSNLDGQIIIEDKYNRKSTKSF